MPPKKGNKGKKSGKKKGQDEVPSDVIEPKAPEPTEKELLLKAEYVALYIRSMC